MPRDDDKSLGDEATLQGGKETPADERSLGDRSTFGGGEGSSLSDLGEFADLPDHDMEIVDLSSRYKIETTLGKGGMGEVLLATDTRLDRKVAIKRIRGDAGSSKAAVARFLTEAKSIAALSHNNVVQVYDYGRDQEGPFLIMEYVAGGSLLDRCKQGPIELEEAVDLACQLCDGLGRAHDAGIIHRDIKPANILLTGDGVPKLTDFGLAKAESRDHTMTMAGAVLGTLDFMPPEQRQDASLVDARSDLWSLAATLYQMVTGKSPKIIRFDSLPPSLTAVLGQALEENKEDRYQAASELKEALQQSLHGGHVASVELEQGVCPSCGTRNEASRKFCRSCAGSLEVDCLSCAVGMPVWEDVCGSCGTRQSERLTERREQMTSQKLEAETFLAKHDYKRATELAVEIGNETDPRLQQLKSWSEEFPEQVESTKRVQIESIKQAIAEALSHEQAYDYSSGIKAFAQIPDSILAGQDLPELEPARDVLARLQEKQGHADTLEVEIKGRIKARNLSGLVFQVETLLELLPERADLLKLQQQLQKRESDLKKARGKTLAAAKASMQQHDYAGALSVIAKLGPEKIDHELAELQSLAKTREAQSQELSRQIRQAVKAEQYEGLLALIEEYLTLKPNDTDALKSRDELFAREQQRQAEAAALLVQQRKEAKKKRTAANELARKQRARKLQIIVGSSIVAAFVLMLSVMFYLRAQRIARDISEALNRGDYAAALELDPGNRQARIMQQNAEDLATALRSRDYRRALQLDPSNAEALSMKKAADIKQALSDGDYVGALQLDPSNAEALSMKKPADIKQAFSDGDYASVLQLDPGNAEALSMKRKAYRELLSKMVSQGKFVMATNTVGGPTSLRQKLVTVRETTLRGAPDPVASQSTDLIIGPNHIFFHLYTDSGKEEENGSFLVGDASGRPLGWIESSELLKWSSRCAIIPKSSSDPDERFRVSLADNAGIMEYDPADLPADAATLALITGPAVVTDQVDRNVSYPVSMLSTRIIKSPREEELDDFANLKLEVVFVIENTAYLNVEYDGKSVLNRLAEMVKNLDCSKPNSGGGGNADPFGGGAGGNADPFGGGGGDEEMADPFGGSRGESPIRFGLVCYQDSVDGATMPKPLVAQQLTAKHSELHESILEMTPFVGYNDIPSDGITALALAHSDAIDWSRNSVKHIVLIGNAPLNDAVNGTECSFCQSISGKLERICETPNDDLWNRVGVDLRAKRVGSNTSGISQPQLMQLYRSGVLGDNLRKTKLLHAVRVGCSVRDKIATSLNQSSAEVEELIGIVNEAFDEVNGVVATLSTDATLNVLLGLDKPRLRLIMMGADIRNMSTQDAFAAQQYKALAGSDGFFVEMKPTTESVISTTEALREKLQSLVNAVTGISVGDSDSVNAEQNEFTTPIFKITKAAPADAGIIEKPVLNGYATLRSKTGVLTGDAGVLVSRNELQHLKSTLESLYTTFSFKRNKVDREDVNEYLLHLQKALASTVSGQGIGATADLHELISDLPLHTESMMMTSMQFAEMETTEFDTWLQKFQFATDAMERRLSSRDWMRVASRGDLQYTLFPLELLP